MLTRPALVIAAVVALLASAGPAAAMPVDGRCIASTEGAASASRLVVGFDATATATQRTAALDDVDATGSQVVTRTVRVVELPAGSSLASAICDIADDPGVRYAEPQLAASALGTVTPNDPYWSQEPDLPLIGTPTAWSTTTGSPGVLVADVDTGVNMAVGDLAPNIWTNPGETGTDALGRSKAANGVDDDGDGLVDDVHGWNFAYGTSDPSDDFGHGTHVGGTITARGNDAYGIAGVTWRSTLLPVKVLSSSGSGYDSTIAAGMSYAADRGARIENLSLGGQGWSQAMADAITSHPSTLFVVAAGNSSANVDTSSFFPCNVHAANEICVAATDNADVLASFSNYGATNVDLAAPGVNTLSWWNGGLRTASGTSMATPHVAGAAALLLAANPALTVAQLKAALLAGVDGVPGLAGRVATGGRLNVARSLALVATGPPAVSVGAVVPSRTGASVAASVTTRGSATSVHLEWGATSAYGSSGAAQTLADAGGAQSVGLAATGLGAGQTVHYRLVATNGSGTTSTPDATFQTAPPPPTATTGSPLGLTWHGAVLTGQTSFSTPSVTAVFEYGATAAYGRTTAVQTLAASGALSAAIEGLTPGSTVHYRLDVSANGETVQGVDATLTVPAQAAPAFAAAVSADQRAATAVTLNGSLDTQGEPVTLVVQYGETPRYDSAVVVHLPAMAAPTPFAVNLAGLLPATAYHWRAVAQSDAGQTATPDAAFSTSRVPGASASGSAAGTVAGDDVALPALDLAVAPTVSTLGAFGVGSDAATLTGFVTTNGADTTVTPEWGTTTAYGTTGAPVTVRGSATPTLVAVALQALPPRTSLHARLDLAGLGGTVDGTDVALTTLAAPNASALPAFAVSARSIGVAALLDGAAADATVRFEWGTSAGALTHALPAQAAPASGVAAATITGLTPGSTLYWRAVVTPRDQAAVTTATVSAQTAAAGPSVTTDTATVSGATSAVVSGTVDPAGATASWLVEWSTDLSFANRTTAVRLAAADSDFYAVSATLTGLPPGATINWHVVAVVAGQRTVGATATFATPRGSLAADAYPALDVAGHSAVLAGFVLAPAGTTATWHFDYGASLNGRTPDATLVGDGGWHWVEAPVGGLASGTPTAFRLVAFDAADAATSATLAFTTDPPGPSLRTVDEAAVTSHGVELTAGVQPNGADTVVRFDVVAPDGSVISSAAQTVPAASGWTQLDITVGGLDASVSYSAHLVASSAAGETTSAEVPFTTAPPGPTILAATVVRAASRSATVEATVASDGTPASVRVETTAVDGTVALGAPVALAAGSGEQVVSLVADGLAPSSEYEYRVLAESAVGDSASEPEAFSTADVGPIVAPLAPQLADGSATLRASVDANGAATSIRFEYRVGGGAPTATPAQSLAADAGATELRAPVSGLPSGSVVSWHVVATNAEATTVSDDAGFTLASGSAFVDVPAGAASTSAHGVHVDAAVNPNGLDTLVVVETTDAAGQTTAGPPVAIAAGFGDRPVSVDSAALLAGSDYSWRLVARNGAGATRGAPVAVHTPPAVADVSGISAMTTMREATIGAAITANGSSTDWWIAYGLDAAYGQTTTPASLGPASTPASVAVGLQGLRPGTTYHYRVYARNALGVTTSGDLTLQTRPALPATLTVQTSAASPTAATVTVTVSGNGSPTSVAVSAWPQSDPSAVITAPAQTLTRSDDVETLSFALTGLRDRTAYSVRAVATNEAADTVVTRALTTPGYPLATIAATLTGHDRTSATLRVDASANGTATGVVVAYWPAADPTRVVSTAAKDLARSDDGETLAFTITGLATNTAYRARAVATNAGGSASSDVLELVTDPAAPSVAATHTLGVSHFDGFVDASLDGDGAPFQYHFEWIDSRDGATRASASTSAVGSAVPRQHFTGLAAGVGIRWRVVASNVSGQATGDWQSFTATPAGAPSVLLPIDASDATIGSDALRADVPVDAGGDATAVTLTVSAAGEPTQTRTVQLDDGRAAFEAGGVDRAGFDLAGLHADTIYRYSVDARNGVGAVQRSGTFTTAAAAAPTILAVQDSTNAAAPYKARDVLLVVDDHGSPASVQLLVASAASGGGFDRAAPDLVVDKVGNGGRMDAATTLSGLRPGAFTLRVAATNAGGTSSRDVPVSVPASPPTVRDAGVSAVGSRAATVAGAVDPLLAPTTWSVEYGVSGAYGSQTPLAAVADGDAPQAVSTRLTGLLPGRLYHYRVVAVQSLAIGGGAPTVQRATTSDATFTTASEPAPSVAVSSVDDVTYAAATVRGVVDPRGNATVVNALVRGPDGTRSVGAVAVPAVSGATSVSIDLSGLSGQTAYGVALVATSDAGTATSDEAPFRTAAPPLPTIVVGTPGTSGHSAVTVQATVRLASDVWVDVGDASGYTRSLPAALDASGNATATIGGLAAGQTVHYRFVASSAVGTTRGDDATATSAAAGAPTIASAGATDVGEQGLRLVGVVNPQGAPTSARFEYGPTGAYGSSTASIPVAAGDADAPLSSPVLVAFSDRAFGANETVHWRLVAANAAGSAAADEHVTTLAAPAVAGASLDGTATEQTGVGQVRLHWTVWTHGLSASARVDLRPAGASTWTSLPSQALPASFVPATLVSAASGLTPGAAYETRIVVSAANGATIGGDGFRVAVPMPTLDTSAAPTVGATSAVLHFTVNGGGLGGSVHVEYGLATLGLRTPDQATVAGSRAYDVQIGTFAPGTTVQWRVVAQNAYTSTASTPASFTTPPPDPPSVTTGAASGVTASAATVAGVVNAVGQAGTTAYVEWGATDQYGSIGGAQAVAADFVDHPLAATLGSLQPNQTYHYRFTAVRGGVTSRGADATFTTLAVLPGVSVPAVLAATRGGATVAGSVAPNGAATACWFEYGPTTAYGQASAAADCAGDFTVHGAGATLSGLSPGTAYHVRLVARSSGGVRSSGDVSFVTAATTAPALAAAAAGAIQQRAASIAATLDTGGLDTTVRVDWGTTVAYGQAASLGSFAGADAPGATSVVNGALAGLLPNTAYHARVVAVNARGTTASGDIAFTTAPLPAPTVVAAPASAVTKTTATVGGSVDPNGLATTWFVEYGGSAAYGTSTAVAQAGSGTGDQAVSVALDALAPGATVHWRLVGVSASGTSRSADQTFTTIAARLPQLTTISASAAGAGLDVVVSVNPNGFATTLRLGAGSQSASRLDAYPLVGAATDAGADSSPRTMTLHLDGLTPASVYRYRVEAASAEGVVLTSEASVRVPALPASATVMDASGVSPFGATLNATVDANGAPTSAHFEWASRSGGPFVPTPAQTVTGRASISAAIGGLAPSSRYYVRVIAANVDTTTVTPESSFVTADVPAATIVSVTPGTPAATGVTLAVSTDTHGVGGSVVARYAAAGQPDAATASVPLAAVAAPQTVSVPVAGLRWSTAYEVRVVVTTSAGSVTSDAQTVTTAPPPPPGAQTGAAGAIGTHGALLNGDVQTNGVAAQAWFEWGADTAYGATTPAADVLGASAIAAPLSGLAPATVYHYRLVVLGPGGTATGADRSFTTAPPQLAAAQTAAASAITWAGAVAGGLVTANGLPGAWTVEYGTTSAYGRALGGAYGPSARGARVAVTLGGLTPGTLYHYRLDATNADGAVRGADMTFTTPAVLAPVIDSAGVSAVTSATAQIGARVNANGRPTTFRLVWGASTAYGSATRWLPAGSARGDVALGAIAANLPASSVVHARIEARSDGGTTLGSDLTLMTDPPQADGAAPVATLAVPTCAAAHQAGCSGTASVASAYATLRGSGVDRGAGASGVQTVEVNAVLRSGATCRAYDGVQFSPLDCTTATRAWIPAAFGAGSFKLAFRSALAAGVYTFRTRATDNAGNTQTAFASGVSQLTVKLH